MHELNETAPSLRLLPAVAPQLGATCHHGMGALEAAANYLEAAAINLENNPDARAHRATAEKQLHRIERAAARIEEATNPTPALVCTSGLPLLEAARYAMTKAALLLEHNAAARTPLVRAVVEKQLRQIENEAARIEEVTNPMPERVHISKLPSFVAPAVAKAPALIWRGVFRTPVAHWAN